MLFAFFTGTSLRVKASNPMMTGCQDDQSLVAACRAGQAEAFGLLVRRYQDRLFPTIARLVGSAEDAQDILQDAFVRGFEKLDQFHGESSFYTWIYRIAINLALSSHRKNRNRRVSRLNRPGRNYPLVDPADRSPESNPTLALERLERETVIQKALGELGPDHRAVIILKDFDGRRYEEISELLNIPIGTVRSRLHRARCELRVRLYSLIDPDINATWAYHEVKM
jgi:RNA polymerase sigma-70 factor (ECF subfamily)